MGCDIYSGPSKKKKKKTRWCHSRWKCTPRCLGCGSSPSAGPGQTDSPGRKDGRAKVPSAVGAVEQHRQGGPQAWQTIAVSPLALPAGRIRRRSLMNQGEHPATGWMKCINMRAPPAPCLARRSPACLTRVRRRANKGAARGGRSAAPAAEPGRACTQSAPARRHGCEERSRSPHCLRCFVLLQTPLPDRTGRDGGSGTDTALLKGALEWGKAPARALPYVPVWGPALLCPSAQVGSSAAHRRTGRGCFSAHTGSP